MYIPFHCSIFKLEPNFAAFIVLGNMYIVLMGAPKCAPVFKFVVPSIRSRKRQALLFRTFWNV